MNIRVVTFNLNNLFSRFNLYTEADPQIRSEEAEETTEEKPRVWPTSPEGEVAEGEDLKVISRGEDRPRRGAALAARIQRKLIYAKEPEAQETWPRGSRRSRVDVLCVQEVEDLAALEDFIKYLDLETAGFKHLSLVEGNDHHFIDIGVISKSVTGFAEPCALIVHQTELLTSTVDTEQRCTGPSSNAIDSGPAPLGWAHAVGESS